VPSVRNPITFSETPADYRRPPPALDEHGAEIRRWLAEPAARPDDSRRTDEERSA
jgi:crotonobetainyl-CoA:carnitine CoA-transferase CaiB-like acyl-CoA transferase